MAKNIRAADLGGTTEGLYIPEYATDLVLSEMVRCSSLQHLVNQSYDVEGLGLTKSPVAHYTILTDIEVGTFGEGNWNGETWEPADPFRDGTVRLCQSVPIKKKFSREEALNLCGRWETVQGGYETAIGEALRRHTELYGFGVLAASADRYNQGTTAGRLSGNINLGNVASPLTLSSSLTPTDVLGAMEQVMQEAGASCGGNALKVAVSPAVFRAIRSEQSKLGAGSCCLDNNPAITGMVHPALGMQVVSSLYMPSYTMSDGRRVEYIVMVNPENIASPATLDYLEWQTILNDIYLVGNYRFETAALSQRSVAVAAVIVG